MMYVQWYIANSGESQKAFRSADNSNCSFRISDQE